MCVLSLGCAAEKRSELVAMETEVPVITPTPVATAEPMCIVIEPDETNVPIAVAPALGTASPSPSPSPNPYAGLEVHFHESCEGFYYVKLTEELKERITGTSYPAEGSDSVSYDDLRYVHILYVDFQGTQHEGELIVNRVVAAEVTDIFYQLYMAGYPLASVRLVDDFDEPFDDSLSMAANNSSSFCYRFVSGTERLSWHAFGLAIDINPLMNPYIVGDHVSPAEGAEYVDRSNMRAGMIDENDLCYQLFISYGWKWGGDFKSSKDYQHFYKEVDL